jgi:hypothetical protein
MLLALLILFLMAGAAFALSSAAQTEGTIILQQGSDGYVGCADTYIEEYQPNKNYCAQEQVRIGYRQQFAALIKFDLGSVPVGATVTRAVLQLNGVGWSGSNIAIDAYALSRSMDVCQATWNQAQTGNPWAVPGGNHIPTDRRGTPESTVTTNGTGRWYEFDLTALVQQWYGGAVANHGVLLRAVDALSTHSFYFASADNGDASLRPRLVITYSLPTPTPTATLTDTPTPTATFTPTSTPTHTPTPTTSTTPVQTPSGTVSPSATIPGPYQTTTLQQGAQGYFGSQDTYIYQFDPNGTEDYWTFPQFRLGYRQQYAAVIRFDLSPIPADAMIVQATLQVYAAGWNGANLAAGAYYISRTTTIPQLTWNQAQNDNLWGLPGANDTSSDRRGTPESTVTTSGIEKWYEFNLTSLVQGWLSGSLANNGVLLRSLSSTSTASTYFSSTESGNPAFCPKLVVVYIGTGQTATPTPTSTLTPTFTPTSTQMPSLTPTGSLVPNQTISPTSSPTVPGNETTVTLQQGSNNYGSSEDTYLYKYSPNVNYCRQEQFRVGYRQQYASLLRFGLESIPGNAVVTRALLQVYASGWSGSSVQVDVHAVARPVNMCQATWNQAGTGDLWSLPGANHPSLDHRSEVEGTFNATTAYRWYELDVTNLVTEWLNGSGANNGFFFQAAEPYAETSFYFASAENGGPQLRPKLVITYSVTGPEATPTSTATETPTTTPTFTATEIGGTPSSATRTATLISGPDVLLTLQQGVNGYDGCEDTTLYEYDPDNTEDYWPHPQLRVGQKQRYAALLRFDLPSIPDDAQVARATLQLYAEGWNGSNLNIGVFGVLRYAVINEATWNQAQTGDLWGVPGCNNPATDRQEFPESTVTTHGTGVWYEFDVTAIARGWVSGESPNNGVLLRAVSSLSSSSFHLASSESGLPDSRPKLVIAYRTGGPGPDGTRTPTRTPTGVGPAVSLTPVTVRTPTATIPSGPSTTVTLQQGTGGYTGCADTSIYQYDPDNADDYWPHGQLKIGEKQRYAALIRFDAAPIPLNAIISKATLQLFAEGWNGADLSIAAYGITRTTVVNEATWNQARTGILWAVPGCSDTNTDRRAMPESTVMTRGPDQWYEFDLTSIVQGWVNRSVPNNGVLLRAASSLSRSAFNFASCEGGYLDTRPRLVVSYRMGAPVPTSTRGPTATVTPTRTATAIPAGGTLVIGHVTDAQIGKQWMYADRLAGIVALIRQQAQVMVDTGDCTEHGTAAESIQYKNIITNSIGNTPWRVLMGNHDEPGPFQLYIQSSLEWLWDVGGYRLIGINSENINYAELDRALTNQKPCILFGHFPMDWYPLQDQAQLRQRFRAFRVPIYISGHIHEDSLTTDAETGTVLLVGANSGPGDYRLITIRGYQVVNISFENPYH